MKSVVLSGYISVLDVFRNTCILCYLYSGNTFEFLHGSLTDFTTASPTLIRTITLSLRLAVFIVWSVPGFVADNIDGSVISVVMVTPSGPKAIRYTTVGKCVIFFAVNFPCREGSQLPSHSLRDDGQLTFMNHIASVM